MKLAYGTYGIRELDPFEALPRLREIGFEAVEIAVAPAWPTAPEKLDLSTRQRLRKLIDELGFPNPPLMMLLSPCVRGEDHDSMRRQFMQACELARELRVEDGPAIVTCTLGGAQPDWESGREKIAADLLELAHIAEEHETIFAIEPHVGGSFDTPEKAAWMMERTSHPHLKLNFDYSHFHVQGMNLDHCVALCVPHAVHAHIKDGWMVDGKVQFLLPGEGELDLAVYLRAMAQAGWNHPITVEVSGMIWGQADYDPWRTAVSCYRALDQARQGL